MVKVKLNDKSKSILKKYRKIYIRKKYSTNDKISVIKYILLKTKLHEVLYENCTITVFFSSFYLFHIFTMIL